jgi:hypothetical protein
VSVGRTLTETVRVLRFRPLVTALLLTVTACGRGKPSPAAGPAPVTNSTPNGAISAFLAAAKARDLLTMGSVWGTDKGSARDQMRADELEKRLVILQCKVDHTSWKFVEDRPRMAIGGRTGDKGEFMVELRLKDPQGGRDIVGKTAVTVVMGPVAKWYVESVDMAPLGEFCR